MSVNSQASQSRQEWQDRPADQVTRFTYAGLFFITMANLMFENLLTRIFSVTLFYNYAFMAISIALFGMSGGSILVYLLPNYFRKDNNYRNLALASFLFAVTSVLSFYIHTQIPFSGNDGNNAWYLFLNFVVISIPFTFGGVVVSLALTKFPKNVSKLYAADLLGAAIGCVFFVFVLRVFSGPTSMIITAVIASIGTLFFALASKEQKIQNIVYAGTAALVVFAVFQIAASQFGTAPLRLKWVKGSIEPPLLYEKWNSYSRVRVYNSPVLQSVPFGWGLSKQYQAQSIPEQIMLDIDSTAATVLTKFDGDVSKIDYLKYDVTNIVHFIRPDSSLLIIGTGGGRDVLSGLVFNQRAITGVEINENIIDVANNQFGDFTGHLDRQPGVKFVRDEARSFTARSTEQYDIIQVSLIDTWAATAAGAYVFTENSLYTAEAWKTFLDHLTPNGVISFSRWYFTDVPVEIYRLASLASKSLMDYGIENPRDHMIIIRYAVDAKNTVGVGTVLVSKVPFSAADIEQVRSVSKEMGFDVILSSTDALDATFEKITSRSEYTSFVKNYPLDISAPTDDRPFFFHSLRLKNFQDQALWNQGSLSFNIRAVVTLGVLLFTVLSLTVLCIIIPILLTTRRKVTPGSAPYLLYFAMIGFGFMLVEISQMQRLTVFLGHPTYSMAAVLFSLLLSSGIGSYLTEKVQLPTLRGSVITRFSILMGMLVLFGLATAPITHAFAGSSNAVRISLSVLLLSPLGLFMGMAFPLGMKAASIDKEEITPWLWGINGATSVCASVIAIAIAMTFSISTSYWTGFACYGLAALSFAWILIQHRKALVSNGSSG